MSADVRARTGMRLATVSRAAGRHAGPVALLLLASCLVGVMVAYEPLLAAVPFVAPVIVWGLRTPLRRLSLVVFGGMVALGSPDLTPTKLLYLAAMVAVLFIVLTRALSQRHAQLPRSTAWGTLALLGIILVGAVNGVVSGNDVLDVLRDSATYGALASAGLIAADAAPSIGRQAGDRLVLSVGLLSAIGFSMEWISRRGLAEFPVEPFLLHSNVPALLLWSYSVARLASGNRRAWIWAVPAGLAFGLPLLSGTRNILLFLAAPIGIVAFSVVKRRGRQVARVLLLVPLAIAVVVGLWQTLGSQGSGGIDTSAALERVSAVTRVIDDPTGDSSLKERIAQTEAAWAATVDAPVFGQGLGEIFEWRRSGPVPLWSRSFTLDTSLVVTAKLGALGLIGVIALWWSWRPLFPKARTWTDAMVGFFVVAGLLSVLGPVIEDKGLPLAIIVLFAGGGLGAAPPRPILPAQ